ncbi:MAG: HEAT repeat domain-containing protein [Gemmatimonadota bacterium]
MTIRRFFSTIALVIPAITLLSAAQAPSARARARTVPMTAARPFSEIAPLPYDEADPADSLYRAAREALNKNQYRRAADTFKRITDRYPKSTYSADALYYRAYALYRLGGEDDLREAVRVLENHHARFPKANTSSDADELAIRIKGALAKRGDAPSAEDVTRAATQDTRCTSGDDKDDIRSEAMNALLQMDAQSALPIIKEVLKRRDACSANLRKKAVFLLSQKPSSETENLMIDVIKNDPSRAVREDAVFWLGQTQSERALTLLEELATSSSDNGLREKAVFALTQHGSARAFAVIRKLAEAQSTPDNVRKQAIFWLGQHRSQENADFLRALYRRSGNDDVARKEILFSLSQMQGFGNDRWILGVANDASASIEVRKQALFTAGQAGISGAELVSLYEKLTERPLKEQLIWVMSDSRDRVASEKLVEIAKSDKDPEMRKKAIFWLGQKNDPRIRQILLDILTKP